MRLILLLFLFFASCSVKDKFTNNAIKAEQPTTSTFSKIDINKDNKISQKEFIEFKNTKKLVDPMVDYHTPLIISIVILLTIFSLCSLTYIADLLKRIYLYTKSLFVK